MKISIIINIISILAALYWPLPTFAKEPPSSAPAAEKTPAHPKNWDSDTRAVYDLLLAQLQSADADYAGSVDTLVKFARTQKNDGLYAKAYKALLQTERYNDAAMLCKTWQQQSKHKGINKFYVLALTLNGDIEQAVNATLQALKPSPDKGQHMDSDDNMDNIERALYPYLQMLVSHWYHPSVTEVIARLYETYPDSELAAIMYVKQLRWQGQLEKAVDIVDKRRFNDPKNLGLVQEISDIYRYAVRLHKADKVWQQLLADYPNEAEFQFAYAQFLFDRYDFAGVAKTLATIDDSNLETQVNTLKIMTAIQLGKYAEAEEIFAKNFTDTAEKQRARYNLANSLLQQKQYDLAKKYFQPLVDFSNENPRDPDIDDEFALPAALKIAQILYAQDDAQAISAGDVWFARLAEHFRFNDAETLQEQANALEKAGHKQLALDRLKAFLDKNPNNEAIRYTRGLIAAEMHLNTLAIEDLKRLYATSPDNIDVKNALGYTLLSNIKDLDEGEALIKKALFSKPDSPAVVDSMGWAYYQRGQFDTALPFFRFSYAAYLDGEIIGHYILALFHAGKPDVAKRLYLLERHYLPNQEKIERIVAPILPQLMEK